MANLYLTQLFQKCLAELEKKISIITPMGTVSLIYEATTLRGCETDVSRRIIPLQFS